MKINKSGSGGASKSGVNVLVGGSSSGTRAGGAENSSEVNGVSAAAHAFGLELNTAARNYDIEDIKKMIFTLDSDAREFEQKQSFASFERYKKKIQTILNEICKRLYNITTKKVIIKRKNNISKKDEQIENCYTIIQKVEGEIAELEKAFNQKADINIIAKNDEIKGLLLNITT